MEEMLIGVTDRTIPIFIPDPASTTGAGKTGLVAANLTVTYTRYETDNDVVHNDVTSSMNDLSALTDAHNDWGWKEVSSTLSKGQYRLDVADACFATGAWYVVIQVTITSGTAAATLKQFRLVSVNALDGVRGGMTALPNAAADAAGGLPISDAGGLDLDSKLANTNEITVARMGALTDWINGGRLDLILDAILSDTNAILVDTGTTLDARIPAALVGGRMDSNVQAMADAVISAAKFAAGAIDAAAINADAIGAAEFAQGAADKVWSTAARTLTAAGTAFAVKKNTALAKFMFKMVDSSDHVTPKTGLTITAERSIDGAAFGACANSATEISAGWYYIDLAAADLNGNVIALKFTATGADQRDILIATQS